MARLRMTRAQASALLLGFVLLCAACSVGSAQSVASVRIAVTPLDNAAEVYYARDLGSFAKAGLDVEIQTSQNAAATGAAIASNAVDIGYMTIDALATAHEKQIPLVVIAAAAEYSLPATAHLGGLVVPPSSAIRVAKDLDGKTIAIAQLHGLSQTLPSLWIDRNGGDSTTVKFVEVPYPAIPAALDSGRVDAAWVVAPFLDVALEHGRFLADCYASLGSHYLVGAWVATPQWAKGHPDVVRRFTAVMRQTAEWANANHARTAEMLAADLKLDPAVLATMVRAYYPDRLTARLLQPGIDASARYGGFSTFSAQELIYVP